jgi:hypothetical protein
MQPFAVIIPDRNDRPEFTSHCFAQLSCMTLKPNEVFHINYAPISKGFDLAERVYRGVLQAKAAGIDLVFIIENDDYYPADYFERMLSKEADFYGSDFSVYYHLKNRTFKLIDHPFRSSLFHTGFKISTLGKFQWHGDQFVDVRLWKHAYNKKLKRAFIPTGAIGMKHGQGLCGGKGHRMEFPHCDYDMNWLKDNVDKESFFFYWKMSLNLWKDAA